MRGPSREGGERQDAKRETHGVFAVAEISVRISMHASASTAAALTIRRERFVLGSRNGRTTSSAAAEADGTSTPAARPRCRRCRRRVIFRVWNIQRKYHSGRMPAGTGANASAFLPELPREEQRERRPARRAPRTTASRRAARSRGRTASADGSPAFALASRRDGGTLMPWRWMRSRCSAEQHRGDGRQDRDVEAVEARQRRAGHVVAAAQEAHHEVADARARRRRCPVPTLVAKNASSFHGSR